MQLYGRDALLFSLWRHDERETIDRSQSDFTNGLGGLYVCAVPLNELQPLAETDVESGTEWKGGWITNKLSLLSVFNVYATSGASKHIDTTQRLQRY